MDEETFKKNIVKETLENWRGTKNNRDFYKIYLDMPVGDNFEHRKGLFIYCYSDNSEVFTMEEGQAFPELTRKFEATEEEVKELMWEFFQKHNIKIQGGDKNA